MFIHLAAHSSFSLSEGLASPEELAQAAKAHNMPALGLTDHRLLAGSIEFVSACREAGVQPILGLEIDLSHGNLALLAASLDGWANLCRLSSALALRDDTEAACPLDLLNSFSNDLIALSGDQGDATGRRLEEIKPIFSDRLYITMQRRGEPPGRPPFL